MSDSATDKTTLDAAPWEALAASGVIPFDAVGDPARVFLYVAECPTCDGERPCLVCGGASWITGESPHPAPEDVEALVARGWPAMMGAEQLAREALAALAPFGVAPMSRVRWRVDHDDEPEDHETAGPGSWCLEGMPTESACVRVGRAGRLWAQSETTRLGWVQSGHIPAIEALWRAGFVLDQVDLDGTATLCLVVAGAP